MFRFNEFPHLLGVMATTSGRAKSRLEEGQVSSRRGCEKGVWGRKAPNAGLTEQVIVSGQWETLNGEAGVQERTFSCCQTSVRGGLWSRRESGRGRGSMRCAQGVMAEVGEAGGCMSRGAGCWGGVREPADSAWVTRRMVSEAGKVGCWGPLELRAGLRGEKKC